MSSTRDASVCLALPAAAVGRALAALPEDQWFDRKSIRVRAPELGDALIAFANADGGLIVVGLSDGIVEGTDDRPEHRNELMQAHVQHCQPAVPAKARLVDCQRDDGTPDHLLIFEVRPGETVYANKRDEVFLRIGDEKRRLSYAQRQELLYDRGQGSFEGRANADTSFDDVDEAVATGYASALKHPDFRRLFVARGLARDGHLTAAGVLLFGREPQRFYPEAFVRVLRYRGSERGTGARQQLVYDEHFEGPIARQLEAARRAITSEQPRRRALTRDGTFEAVPLVPEDAWLEGLVNATVHRSYSLAGDHIRVEIFADRIEITSPGRFPGLVDPANPLGAPRYARNPRIARVCADQNFGQELGEGIRRMFEEMRLAGLADPLYEQSAASVKLTLVAEPVDRRLEERLPRDARALMAALRNAGSLSTGELAEYVHVSRVTAAKQLKMLKENGLVVWDGKSPKDPRASWALAPTDSS